MAHVRDVRLVLDVYLPRFFLSPDVLSLPRKVSLNRLSRLEGPPVDRGFQLDPAPPPVEMHGPLSIFL